MKNSLFSTNALPKQRVVALAGNPNVGKSTLFNRLTGLRQHTGNWPGKTVAGARGFYHHRGQRFCLVDLPGTYSLSASSPEEEITREFICSGVANAVVIVADATCLERNLNLVLQILEHTSKAVLCLNLMDEAKRKKIAIDCARLELLLGIPVAVTDARSRRGIDGLIGKTAAVIKAQNAAFQVMYSPPLEEAIATLRPFCSRFAAVRLLEGDETLKSRIMQNAPSADALLRALTLAETRLQELGIGLEEARISLCEARIKAAEEIAVQAVRTENKDHNRRDRRIDALLTSQKTGIPLMMLFFAFIFWLTISGANYPSALLSSFFAWGGQKLEMLALSLRAPDWLRAPLLDGVYRTLAWVVSVMLPPMAIFFPLFTFIEDLGYLPRIAFNLDNYFRRAHAHGKQALTMCMGFGCNAAGVVGCRIIDSPRERLIAILTNNFVPCNGRFPALISISAMFIAGGALGFGASFLAALTVLCAVVLGVAATLLVSRWLSATVLKGLPSGFVLEMPPYRRPQ
ncbi:MAG: ferrous iron transport protein B, partial [Clostridiales bacterium]|nr:ferrous iron transport protein B [Clostridiales bacterium]